MVIRHAETTLVSLWYIDPVGGQDSEGKRNLRQKKQPFPSCCDIHSQKVTFPASSESRTISPHSGPSKDVQVLFHKASCFPGEPA